MTDMKKLVRELQDAEDDAGRNGHTAERHLRIVSVTQAIMAAANIEHATYIANGGNGYLFTITEDHVRDPRGTLGQRYFAVAECMGRLQRRDIGKRVYSRGGVLQVENDEQRNLRETFQRAKHAPAPPAYIGHHKHLHR